MKFQYKNHNSQWTPFKQRHSNDLIIHYRAEIYREPRAIVHMVVAVLTSGFGGSKDTWSYLRIFQNFLISRQLEDLSNFTCILALNTVFQVKIIITIISIFEAYKNHKRWLCHNVAERHSPGRCLGLRKNMHYVMECLLKRVTWNPLWESIRHPFIVMVEWPNHHSENGLAKSVAFDKNCWELVKGA